MLVQHLAKLLNENSVRRDSRNIPTQPGEPGDRKDIYVFHGEGKSFT